MSRIYTNCPPEGTPIAIAFSGGLDTRTAVLWLSEKKIKVYAYTANLNQPDEKDISSIPEVALLHGAVQAELLDCRLDLAKQALIALQCGAFHIQSGGRKYFNTTPLGRIVTSRAILHAMKKDGVEVFGDGSTHKGNDIQRFYRYGVLGNPNLKIYKPWLDENFVNELGGRREMSAFLERHGKPYHMSAPKAYSTDANFIGATHEAKDLESLEQNMYCVKPIMGLSFWEETVGIKKEKVKIEFEKGVPVSINDKKENNLVEIFNILNEIGGRHGIGMSDQIENRVIEAKSRGIYEAPGIALLHIVYERLLSATHNENTLDIYFSMGRKLARLLYEGRWLDPEALLIRSSLVSYIADAVNGFVVLELRRGEDYTILETYCPKGSYHPETLSMEKSESVFSPFDRIGALAIQDLGIMANRGILEKYIDTNTLDAFEI